MHGQETYHLKFGAEFATIQSRWILVGPEDMGLFNRLYISIYCG